MGKLTADLRGNGFTISQTATSGGSATLLGGVTQITFGGYSEEMQTTTELINSAVVTKSNSGLKEYNDVTVTVKALAAKPAEGNSLFTINPPTSGGSAAFSFYGQLSARGDMTLEPGAQVMAELTITPTGVDFDGNEAPPTLTL